MKTINNIWNKVIFILFFIFILTLAITSLFWVMDIDWVYFREITTIMSRNPIVTSGYIIIVTLVFMTICYISSKTSNTILSQSLLPGITVIIHVILALLWIRYNTYPTDADQKSVCDAAMALERGLPIDTPEYFVKYPFNAGIVYAIRFAMKVTGIVDSLAWRYFNVAAVVTIDLAVILLTREIAKDHFKAATNITAVELLIFIPTVLFTTFVYGTLVSMSLALWAIWCTIRFSETKNILYGLIVTMLLPIANRIYSGTVIATIAVVITLFIELLINKKTEKIKFLTIIALLIAAYFASGTLIRHMFYNETGIEKSDSGLSATAYLYIGIAEQDGVAGPGSFSGAADDMYREHGEDTNKYALQQDIQVMKEYATGQRDISFFADKTKYQWLDPWFGGLTMTCYPWGDFNVDKSFYNFLYSPIPKMIYKYLLRNFLPSMYVMALLGGLVFIKKSSSKAGLLLALYFVGGFIFQFFWESKSRYCLPYFVSILPIAALGVSYLAQTVTQKLNRS